MATNGVYVKPEPIGSAVVTTDDVIAAGYDYSYLKMGGMLKVQENTHKNDLTLKGDTKYVPPVAVESVTVAPATSSVVVGATRQLNATVVPAGASNKTVQWASSDATVATVSATGLVTGVKAGTATITAKTVDGNHTATTAMTVTAA